MISNATGIVLAGGDSSRFQGGHKALATLDGERFITRICDVLDQVMDPRPVVVLRSTAQRSEIEPAIPDPDSVTFAYDDPSLSGPAGGLYGAIDVATSPWLFVTGCDMPLLSPEMIAWIHDEFVEEGLDAVVPKNEDGEAEPLHAFYRRESLTTIKTDLNDGEGVHGIINRLSEVEFIPFSESSNHPSFERSLTNINTRDELRTQRARL